MGFISYSLSYYASELQALEMRPATRETIYRAKQLLKMLDDLADEGYTELNDALEQASRGVSRLRKYLEINRAAPFPIVKKPVGEADIAYARTDTELTAAIGAVCEKAEAVGEADQDAFLTELIRFCEWIGYEEDTAYIFLLRDTLLPFIYYQSRSRAGVYPWLLGRKTLAKLTGKAYADDEIRACVIKALEQGQCRRFDAFCGIVLPDIRATLRQYPEAENCLAGMLGEIRAKRILAIESGCSGTFPMLLMALDNRVDMRMYTTYPYLSEVYGERIFTPKYEENRLFETLYSQDLYFQFSDIRNGRFYVRQCENPEVEKKALAEIKAVLGQTPPLTAPE